MKLVDARRIIWERLATTAREDGIQVDWSEEGDYDEFDVRRLQKASKQVADTIERRLRRERARGE